MRHPLLVLLLVALPASAHHADDIFTAPGDPAGTIATPFAPAGDCLACHANVDAPDRVAPGDGWLGSMKANSFRDPLFQAALTIANQDFLESGTFCLRCHAPVGWIANEASPADGSGMTEDARRDGVSCAFCHRLDDGDDRDVPGPLVGNGAYYLFDDAAYRSTRHDTQPPHAGGHGKHLSSSWTCAGCHSLTNPVRSFVDPEAPERELGPAFPALRTFEEWRDSDFAREGVECQTCHMPRAPGRLASDPEARLRPDVATHDFAGGNAWGALLLDAAYPGERPEAYAAAYDAAVASLRRAAGLRIDGLPAVLDADGPTPLRVRVENRAGHKLPTGYANLRRVWLEVSARLDDDEPFFLSGRWDPQTASPVPSPDLRTYEARAGVAGEGPGFHFILNDAIYLDTRLPPRGLRAQPDTRPVGRDYALPDGTQRHWDEAPYVLPAPPARRGVVTVTARLLYQSVTPEYVAFLRDENVLDGLGQRLHALWQQTGRAAPIEMARAEARVLVEDTPAGDEVCNGADDDRDGVADEGFGEVSCGDGACARTMAACRDGALRACEPGAPGREICDGEDDDCDGAVDEQVPDQVCGRGRCRRVVAGCAGECEPGAPAAEACNGDDDDCDGVIDEALGEVTCGRGACRVTLPACRGGAMRPCEPAAPDVEVCNDVDDDCDGTVDEDAVTACERGVCRWTIARCGAECAAAPPDLAQPEVCNGVDDDCDGVTDEDTGAAACGEGACRREVPACAACVPGEPEDEVCNGADDDCDGATDEGQGTIACGEGACRREVDGCATCAPGPPADEACNGIDDDCDTEVDEEQGETECGVGACARAVAACGEGAPLPCVPGTPGAEVCNGADDDCDGATDEGAGTAACGTGACRREVPACAACVPGAPVIEACNGADDDCDGATDERLGDVTCGTGACARTVPACRDGALVECVAGAPGAEVCDGRDGDCDERTDEGCTADGGRPDAGGAADAGEARGGGGGGCRAVQGGAGGGLLLLPLAVRFVRRRRRSHL